MVFTKPSMVVKPYEYTLNAKSFVNQKEDYCPKKVDFFTKQQSNTTNLTKVILRRLNSVKWRLWIMGAFVYVFMLMAMSDDQEELLTEEDHMSLRQWVEENDDVLRAEYKDRSETTHTVCDQYDVHIHQNEYNKLPKSQQLLEYSDWLALKRVNWNYMYYVPSEDLVYCKVPKSGSSTWVYNLLKLANAPQDLISSDIGLHKILRDYYPQMSSNKMKRVFKRSFKLLVVRHPFDRILSAYRDKMEDFQRDLRFRDGYYYTMYGKNIVNVYRDQNDNTLANRTEPTWVEFVKYLINTPASKFDEHWKPIYLLCSPCVLKYDVIARMNTFSEDTQYVINQLGLEDRLHVEWIHRTSASKTSEVIKKYYSQLTEMQMDHLYAKYHLDFELFGYNYDDYRQMVSDS